MDISQDSIRIEEVGKTAELESAISRSLACHQRANRSVSKKWLGGRKMMRSRTRGILHLLVSILVCEFAGIVGSIFTTPAIPTWYASLRKPSFTPPSWVFAPVWVTLYALMGMALYVTWKEGLDRHDVRRAVGLFAVQLTLNVLWSLVFFGLQSAAYGFAVIIILWIAVLVTTVLFYKISKTAGVLLVPYFLWGSLASALNFSILLLNP
jgi:benzodiazapine receptor